MQIWTFWEPRNKIPYYLQLCMRTWSKFLPEANVTLLDFSNIQNYVNVNEFRQNLLSGRFSLPHIADAIRVMLLEKYGGIWLDVDTIILDRSAKIYFVDSQKDMTFFGNMETGSCHLAFINSKPTTKCMTLWRKIISEKLTNLTPEVPIGWDFLGNSFINDYAKNNPDEINLLDRNLVMPELELTKSDISSDARRLAYLKYYFIHSRHIEDVTENMLMLHNSWTPARILQMDENEFLRCNFTIANVLMAALNMKRNCKESPIQFNLN